MKSSKHWIVDLKFTGKNISDLINKLIMKRCRFVLLLKYLTRKQKRTYLKQDSPAFTKSIMSQLVLDLQRIHGLGVRKVGVTAMHPLGCLPITTASMSHKNCSENGNSLAKFHNQMLQENIENLNNEAGAPVFVILDLYSAFMSALNLQNNHPGNHTQHQANIKMHRIQIYLVYIHNVYTTREVYIFLVHECRKFDV